MNQWLYVPAFMAVFCAVMYLLYRKGVVSTKCIRAILFVFRPGKDADRFTLDSCTGWVEHRGRFHGCRAVALDARLSKGEAEVLLLDQDRRPVWRLSRQCPEREWEPEEGTRYYLRWEFKGASGKCELRWR